MSVRYEEAISSAPSVNLTGDQQGDSESARFVQVTQSSTPRHRYLGRSGHQVTRQCRPECKISDVGAGYNVFFGLDEKLFEASEGFASQKVWYQRNPIHGWQTL